jgi:hypothetical protein
VVDSKARLDSSRFSTPRPAERTTIQVFYRLPGVRTGRQSGSSSASRTLSPRTDRRRRTFTTFSFSMATLVSSVLSARIGRGSICCLGHSACRP